MKKTLTILTALLVGALCLLACGDNEPVTKDVTSVTLSTTTLILYEGASETLTATVLPADADDKRLTWTSSDNSIATVNNGTVTAIKEGTTTITAKSHNNKTAVCAITVNKNIVDVTEVSLNKVEATLVVGTKETLIATIAPADATNKNVTWSSDKPAIATVSQSGEVTAIAVGEATITVTTEDGDKTATCAITVVATTIPVTAVSLNKTTLALTEGEKETLTATITPATATNKNVTWSSNKPDIATVNQSGEVTAIKTGEATITVTTEDGGKTATCAVTITIGVSGVSLNKASSTIVVGASETLTATVTPATATNKKVSWSSNNEPVATVSQTGEITAIAVGTATITVTTEDGNKTATCTVSISVAVTGVSLNKSSSTLTVGTQESLTATVSPTTATNKNITWSSNNEPIATVSQTGEITAIAVGTATITVTTEDGNKTATCAITVVAATVPVTGVNLNKTTLELLTGNGELLTATVAPTTATDKTVTWTSNNPAVATVSAGYVTALTSGAATITVTTTDGNFTATCAVTVPTPASTTGKVSINNGAEVDFTTGLLADKFTGTVTKIVFGNNATINGTDIKAMMALSATLTHLDMTKATIVQGGEAYPGGNGSSHNTVLYEISNHMFYEMAVLETVMLPANTTNIRVYAFRLCSQLKSYNIPEGVLMIEQSAFAGATMPTVSLPASLTYIPAMDGTLGRVNNINVAVANTTYASIDGVLYSKDQKTLIRCPYLRTSYSVPEGVTTLALSCFDVCSIASLNLPASLDIIYGSAIRLTQLTTLTIPANVRYMGSAITQNALLETIVVQAATPPAGSDCVRANSVLTAIYVPDASVAAYKAAAGWSNNAAIIKPMSEKP